jgi:CRP-like cAMP-binding protein
MLDESLTAGLRERLIMMRRVNSFGRLSDHAMLLITEHARVRSFPDGALALEEGHFEYVHVVTSGRFEVTRKGHLVTTVNAGGAIGAISAMARDSHGVTARAIGPARTLEIPLDVFVDVNEESFPVLRVGLRVFSRQLIETRGHYTLAPAAHTAASVPPSARISARPPGRELSLVERVIELAERGLFRHWNANAIFDIARTATEIRLPHGAALWNAGDPANSAFHLVKGELTCREPCAHPFNPGAMLGMLEMLGELPCVHTPIANGDCVLLQISHEDLLAALDTHRDLAMALVAEASRRLLPGEDPQTAAQ